MKSFEENEEIRNKNFKSLLEIKEISNHIQEITNSIEKGLQESWNNCCDSYLHKICIIGMYRPDLYNKIKKIFPLEWSDTTITSNIKILYFQEITNILKSFGYNPEEQYDYSTEYNETYFYLQIPLRKERKIK